MPSPEQQLDEIFHAIPEWVRRNYPETTNAERIRKGFEDAQRTWTDTYLREVKDHERTKGFLLYLVKTHGLDFGQEYWNYLTSKDLETKKKSENGS